MTPIEYLLFTLGEEAGEIQQAASKIARFGPLSLNPSTGRTNLQELVKEINDVIGTARVLRDELQGHYGLEMQGLEDPAAIQAKMDKVLQFAVVSARLGRVQDYDDALCRCLCKPCQCPPNLTAKRNQPNG